MGSGVKRILLMDDSPVFLDVMGAALREAGFDVTIASDLEQLQRARVYGAADLVLMDVQMPDAHGDDLAMVMRHTYGITAPIYLLSSLDDDELAERAAWAKVDGFISKDKGLPAMLDEVRRILNG
jgi:CheY-like chemotaxis protein